LLSGEIIVIQNRMIKVLSKKEGEFGC